MTIYTAFDQVYRPMQEKYLFPSFEKHVRLADGSTPALVPVSFGKIEGGQKSLDAVVNVLFREMVRHNLSLSNEGITDGFIGWVGADVQFFANPIPAIMAGLEHADIVSICDGHDEEGKRNYLCPDFWFCRCTDDSLNFMEWVVQHSHEYRNNQCAWNDRFYGVKDQSVPDAYFGGLIYSLSPLQFWSVGEQSLESMGYVINRPDPKPPKTIIAHHASFVRGVQAKEILLEKVKQKVAEAGFEPTISTL